MVTHIVYTHSQGTSSKMFRFLVALGIIMALVAVDDAQSERSSMVSSASSASKAAPNSARASMTAASPTKAPHGFFNCTKCKQTLNISLMCSVRASVCKADSNSYKALTTKWGKQRSLKVWWDGASFKLR